MGVDTDVMYIIQSKRLQWEGYLRRMNNTKMPKFLKK